MARGMMRARVRSLATGSSWPLVPSAMSVGAEIRAVWRPAASPPACQSEVGEVLNPFRAGGGGRSGRVFRDRCLECVQCAGLVSGEIAGAQAVGYRLRETSAIAP